MTAAGTTEPTGVAAHAINPASGSFSEDAENDNS